MSVRAKIGEYQPLGFLLAIVVFFIFSFFIFRSFTFYQEPKASDEISALKVKISNLESRVTDLEKLRPPQVESGKSSKPGPGQKPSKSCNPK